MNEMSTLSRITYLKKTGFFDYVQTENPNMIHESSIDGVSDVFSEVLSVMDRTASLDQLPPPDHCSTPKTKSQQSVARQSKIRLTPVSTWIADLKDCYQPECTTTLQSKPLAPEIDEKVKILASLTSQVIRTLHHQTYSVAMEFDNFYRCVAMDCLNHIPGLAVDLVNHMIAILLQHSDGCPDLSEYSRIACTLERQEPYQMEDLVRSLNSLALDFSRKMDRFFIQQLEILNLLLTWKRGSHADGCECKGCLQF
ncbi:inscuteable homolog (Drosophila) [Nesidiocoris tenuis]|uniref:Inscuteable homolog (Drosophila) n=1 Tax=Nesidiocoris tenuis TaxID=355587 RepID=A0ABN7AF33_9HEMI|nr:inscuteable homolog (Drosophila) [Nesidiocoris tenuis]